VGEGINGPATGRSELNKVIVVSTASLSNRGHHYLRSPPSPSLAHILLHLATIYARPLPDIICTDIVFASVLNYNLSDNSRINTPIVQFREPDISSVFIYNPERNRVSKKKKSERSYFS
jgi:hypothetical protein